MARNAPDPVIILSAKPPGQSLTQWLHQEFRAAILSGRLRRGSRLPATRDLASVYGISRRVVVNVYEQLREEGYLDARVGSGTTVGEQVPEDFLAPAPGRRAPEVRDDRIQPVYRRPARPFRPIEGALDEFPTAVWARVGSRVLRGLSTKALAGGDMAGSSALREEVAAYLGSSRGVLCSPDQIVIVSGAQQALDLLARLLIRPGDPVWLEDPGYSGALDAFRIARARIVAVRVDEDGLDPAHGRKLCPRPKAVYLTPAHQFGLGTTLSLERRFDLLQWARQTGAVLIEDDYDSEFRFSGRPVQAMKAMDGTGSIFLIGSFNKVLFPSLRLGYVLVPDRWMDAMLALRYQSDRYPPAITQSILARFLAEGHFARHIRRMRELYGARRAAMEHYAGQHWKGLLRLPAIAAGLSTPAYLENDISSEEAERRAAAARLEAWPLNRFAIRRRDLRGLMLGFAAFREREIREAVLTMERALSRATP